MNALQYLNFLVRSTEEFPGFGEVDYQPPFSNPRHIGPFGAILTDRHTQAVMIDGTRFTVTVEKDPYQ